MRCLLIWGQRSPHPGVKFQNLCMKSFGGHHFGVRGGHAGVNRETWWVGSFFQGEHVGGHHFGVRGHPEVKL